MALEIYLCEGNECNIFSSTTFPPPYHLATNGDSACIDGDDTTTYHVQVPTIGTVHNIMGEELESKSSSKTRYHLHSLHLVSILKQSHPKPPSQITEPSSIEFPAGDLIQLRPSHQQQAKFVQQQPTLLRNHQHLQPLTSNHSRHPLPPRRHQNPTPPQWANAHHTNHTNSQHHLNGKTTPLSNPPVTPIKTQTPNNMSQ